MSKIKLLVEVDKKYYEACKDAVEESYPSQIEEVIANGIPYNSQGDLISREALKEAFDGIDWFCIARGGKLVSGAPSVNKAYYKASDIYRVIDNAPTVDLKDIYQEGYYDGHLDGYTKAINEGGAE